MLYFGKNHSKSFDKRIIISKKKCQKALTLKHHNRLSSDYQVIHQKIDSNNTIKSLKPFFVIFYIIFFPYIKMSKN